MDRRLIERWLSITESEIKDGIYGEEKKRMTAIICHSAGNLGRPIYSLPYFVYGERRLDDFSVSDDALFLFIFFFFSFLFCIGHQDVNATADLLVLIRHGEFVDVFLFPRLPIQSRRARCLEIKIK